MPLSMKLKKDKQDVTISTYEGFLECSVKHWSTVKALILLVAEEAKVKEVSFFGLQYTDTSGFNTWMRVDRKVLEHPITKLLPIRLRFLFKFFPEDVRAEISERSTLRLLYLQVKDMVTSEKITDLPFGVSLVLASIACQVQHGAYKDGIDLGSEKLLPKSLQNKEEECLQTILQLWREHGKMGAIQAMYAYICKVKDNSHMFGVSVFCTTKAPKSQEKQLFCVDSQSVRIYEYNQENIANILSTGKPQFLIPWGQIREITHKKDALKIKLLPVGEERKIKVQDVVVYTESREKCKHLQHLCIGNYEMNVRRKAGTLNVINCLPELAITKNSDRSSSYSDDTSTVSEVSSRCNTLDKDISIYPLEPVVEEECAMTETIEVQESFGELEDEVPIDVSDSQPVKKEPINDDNSVKKLLSNFWQRAKLRIMQAFCFY